MEKVERKRKTDRDLYDVEVFEVDTTRKQLKIHFVGLRASSYEPGQPGWLGFRGLASSLFSLSKYLYFLLNPQALALYAGFWTS